MQMLFWMFLYLLFALFLSVLIGKFIAGTLPKREIELLSCECGIRPLLVYMCSDGELRCFNCWNGYEDKNVEGKTVTHNTIDYWIARFGEVESKSEMAILAEDLIYAADADYEVWMRKIERAEEAFGTTQLEIVIEDLMVLL